MKICLPHVQSVRLGGGCPYLCNELFLDLVAHNHFLGISGSSLVTVGTCQLPLADSCSYIIFSMNKKIGKLSFLCQSFFSPFNKRVTKNTYKWK